MKSKKIYKKKKNCDTVFENTSESLILQSTMCWRKNKIFKNSGHKVERKKSVLHVPKKKMIDFQTLWDSMIDKFTSPVFWL